MPQYKLDSSHVKAGIVGGVVGGVVFGVMMAMMGMLPMVAKLVGAESVLVGFALHIIFSIIFGIAFAVLFGRVSVRRMPGIIWGLVYGAILWVFGPLVTMPLALGMGVRLSTAGATAALPSLWGHLVFGLILGLLFSVIASSAKPHLQAVRLEV